MTNQVNIISICCNVFLDVIDHSKKPDSEQIVSRNHMNDLISIAFKYIGKTDRIMLNTGDGAAIVYMGSPEDAMFMAMDIRKGVLRANKPGITPMSVCIGIHLESVCSLNDINVKPNIIGDGINTAKRIMSHAKPNEILVSREYYENSSPSTQQISTMFNGSGVKQENHVLEYQAYLVNLNQNITHIVNQPLTSDQPIILTESLKSSGSSAINWKYAVVCSFFLITLFAVVKLANAPESPKQVLTPHKTVENSALEKKLKAENLNTLVTNPNITLKEESFNDKNDALMQEKIPKKLEQDIVKTNLAKKDVKQIPNRVDSTPEKNKTKEIISWKILQDSIRQGQKNKCTQLEITLKQCD
ncbi:MAG TPA: adenylate/guanylate cyclase domain-containing protein [Methylotenera sp.]|nr:adenylate/guanylate cyclase domain-containing protein [Methylotenera sp.]